MKNHLNDTFSGYVNLSLISYKIHLSNKIFLDSIKIIQILFNLKILPYSK